MWYFQIKRLRSNHLLHTQHSTDTKTCTLKPHCGGQESEKIVTRNGAFWFDRKPLSILHSNILTNDVRSFTHKRNEQRATEDQHINPHRKENCMNIKKCSSEAYIRKCSSYNNDAIIIIIWYLGAYRINGGLGVSPENDIKRRGEALCYLLNAARKALKDRIVKRGVKDSCSWAALAKGH